jgi:hypothetical protein
VGQVAPKFGDDASRAFAICTAALQKGGTLKRGTQKLTKKGRGNAISRGKEKDETGSKDAAYERALKASKKAKEESCGNRHNRAKMGALPKMTSGSLSDGAFPKPTKKKKKTMDSYKIKIREALELVGEAREDLLEAVWRTKGSPKGGPERQEPMQAMQAVLRSLPAEAKRKIATAEVSHPKITNKTFVEIAGPWRGRNFKVVVSMTYVPKGQVGREDLEIGAYLDKPGGDPLGRDSDSNLFKGKPAGAEVIGGKAGKWLRGVMLKVKK